MRRLEVGSVLYHAGYAEIPRIDLTKCAAGKDFGQGFYVTSSIEQANAFVPSSVRRAIAKRLLPPDTNAGYVNVYRIVSTDGISEYDFADADRDWLHYVAGNRDSSLFLQEISALSSFNVIGGKIANDQTSATLNQYIGFSYGEPGTAEADDFCIRKLLPNRLNDQYCFKNEAAIHCLEFVKAVRVSL